MKVLIRRMFPCPPLPRWRAFEGLMKECLHDLGHETVELDLDPTFPPDPPDIDFRIYCHKTKREAPQGDLFYKEMHMQGLFTIDHQGWGPEHSGVLAAPDLSQIEGEAAKEFCSKLRAEFLSSGKSKHRQPPLAEIDPAVKPYFLVPLQLPTDDVIMYHSPLSVPDFLNRIADWAEAQRHNVVLKLHPGHATPEIEALARHRATGKHVFLLNENIHSLIANCAGVIAINSGVGFETLIHGRPMITMGACDYESVTQHTALGTLNDAIGYVASFCDEDALRGYKFVYFYYHEHAYLMSPETNGDARERLWNYLSDMLGRRLGRLPDR